MVSNSLVHGGDLSNYDAVGLSSNGDISTGVGIKRSYEAEVLKRSYYFMIGWLLWVL